MGPKTFNYVAKYIVAGSEPVEARSLKVSDMTLSAKVRVALKKIVQPTYWQ